jgi:hypothetical protein
VSQRVTNVTEAPWQTLSILRPADDARQHARAWRAAACRLLPQRHGTCAQMWDPLRKILSRSKSLRATLGDVVFETPRIRGQTLHSAFQWRIKKDLDSNSFYVGLKLLPDAHIGVEGRETNYINFDIEGAKRIRADLDSCIAEYQRLTRFGRTSFGQRGRDVPHSD